MISHISFGKLRAAAFAHAFLLPQVGRIIVKNYGTRSFRKFVFARIYASSLILLKALRGCDLHTSGLVYDNYSLCVINENTPGT